MFTLTVAAAAPFQVITTVRLRRLPGSVQDYQFGVPGIGIMLIAVCPLVGRPGRLPDTGRLIKIPPPLLITM